jgi:hypothetical protein
MSDSSTENTSVRAAPPAREVRVVNWPMRDDPGSTLAVAGCCVAVGVLAAVVAGSWWMGLLSSGALGMATWKLWIPIACDMGPAGITLSVWRWRRHISWRQIDRVQCESRGVFLCGPGAGSGARGWGSLYLPWRRQTNLVAEFHDYYCRAASEPVRLLDTSLR